LALAAALTSLMILAGPATALTLERTYLPPFDHPSTELSGCDAPWCAGETSADPSGALGVELRVLGVGIGRSDMARASVKLTHIVQEPVRQVSIDLNVHIDAAYASAIGAPYAQSAAKVALEALPLNAPGSYQYVEAAVAGAESPVGEAEKEDQDLVLSATLGDGSRLIPAGPIEITVFLIAETTTMQPHAHSAAYADGCASSCLGVGSVEASIAGEARSVTVKEIR
jgi:hypothetical protein